ncbi:MAG: hypothetical protein ACI4OX_03595, partial [Akkermansia sp.]
MKLHLPKGLRAALLACFGLFSSVSTTLPALTIGAACWIMGGGVASAAATIITFGGSGIDGVTTDVFTINGVGASTNTLKDGGSITITPTATVMWSGDTAGKINGSWTNSSALSVVNTALGLTDGKNIEASVFSTGSTCYFTASGGGSSTSSLTIQMGAEVAIGDTVTIIVAATRRDNTLDALTANGLEGSTSLKFATNNGTGFSDTAAYSSGGGNITLVQYTGVVGADRSVTFNSSSDKNGWQLAAYNVTAAGTSYLVWNGTDSNNTWNTTDTNTNWLSGSTAAAFTDGSYVRFTTAATNKTVEIAGDISSGAIDVLADYTFNVTANSALSTTGTISIVGGKTLTKSGTGTLDLGTDTINGDFKITEGEVTSSGVFNGLLTIDGGNLTYTASANNANNKFNNISVSHGKLTINAQTNEGGTIIGTGSTVNIREGGTLVLTGHDLLSWWSTSAPAEIILAGSAGADEQDTSKFAVWDI